MMIYRTGDWASAKVADEIMMINIEQCLYLGMNAVGARIWELIEQPAEIEVVCAALRTEFDVAPDVCRAEVDAFVKKMAAYGAIAVG